MLTGDRSQTASQLSDKTGAPGQLTKSPRRGVVSATSTSPDASPTTVAATKSPRRGVVSATEPACKPSSSSESHEEPAQGRGICDPHPLRGASDHRRHEEPAQGRGICDILDFSLHVTALVHEEPAQGRGICDHTFAGATPHGARTKSPRRGVVSATPARPARIRTRPARRARAGAWYLRPDQADDDGCQDGDTKSPRRGVVSATASPPRRVSRARATKSPRRGVVSATESPPSCRSCSSRPDSRRARAGAWYLRLGCLVPPARWRTARRARAGAWYLRHVFASDAMVRSIHEEPAQGRGICDQDETSEGTRKSPHEEPAQGRGICDDVDCPEVHGSSTHEEPAQGRGICDRILHPAAPRGRGDTKSPRRGVVSAPRGDREPSPWSPLHEEPAQGRGICDGLPASPTRWRRRPRRARAGAWYLRPRETLAMRVIGIDPGYAACGVALLDEGSLQQWRPVVLDTIRTPAGQPLAARLHTVWLRVGEIVMASMPCPALMAVEAQARAQAGYRERGMTSDNVLAVREVTGLLRALAWQHRLAFVEVEPATWRACLGLPARASKAQVQRAVQARLGAQGRLSEHAADAVAVALAGRRLFTSPAKAARK